MGDILDMVKRDARIILNGGFSVPLTLTNGVESVEINGFATVHSQVYDPESGTHILGDNSNISFSEKDINDLGVVTRNADGKIIIQDWIVEFDHAIGHVKAKLVEPMPDSTLGVVKCLLRNI